VCVCVCVCVCVYVCVCVCVRVPCVSQLCVTGEEVTIDDVEFKVLSANPLYGMVTMQTLICASGDPLRYGEYSHTHTHTQ